MLLTKTVIDPNASPTTAAELRSIEAEAQRARDQGLDPERVYRRARCAPRDPEPTRDPFGRGQDD